MCLFNFIVPILSVLLFSIYFVKRKFSYWKNKNVPFLQPSFPYGNMNGPYAKVHVCVKFQEHYNKMKNVGPYCGLYMFLTPILFVLDLEFVKTICVKDFQYFVNRGLFHNEKDDPLSGNLLNIEGQKWKDLRAKLTPTFTSGKMKFMFPTIIKVAEEFKKCVDLEIKLSSEIEMKEVLARFTTDVIGTCAFGLECNSLKDPNAIFREMGRKVFAAPANSLFKNLFMTSYPNLARRLHMTTTRKDVADFFLGVVKDTIKYREKNNLKLNDFMTILVELKNNKENFLKFEEIAAQAFIFFLAGFETSSTVMSFAMYELSRNQLIQEKARQEVQNVLKKYNGEFTYEAMLELKYVEQIINESLRKYPPVTNLVRKTTKQYNDTNTKIELSKDLMIFVPVYSIHHDPRYYPNPDIFDPDRFTDENIQKRHPFAFLPFGDGPRNCIGFRFGMMQSKVGLATLLLNFKFTLSPKFKVPLKFRKDVFVLTSDQALLLNIENI